ncbi:MAG TPA: hypothetical protein VF789_22170 [Thermoanaerobaculia bacterium]
MTLFAVALPLLIGAVLRLWNLPAQILGGDEVHALRAAVSLPLAKILVTYHPADNCIPLTALYKLFMLAGLPMTEMTFRLPVLLCGFAALLALPAAFAERLDRRTVLVYRWLVAISPALVLYSRIARSYMPMVLLSFGAVMAFEAWWRTRSWRTGAAYVLLGALAVWFHLGAGPIVAAPFVFAAGELLARRADPGRGLRDLVVLGLSLAAAFALFLVPSRHSLLALIAKKSKEQAIPWSDVVPDLFRLQAGTRHAWLAALFWLAALAGLALLMRRDRRLALFTVTVAAGHVFGLLILSPMGLDNATIFGRYLLPILPFTLLWVASAFGGPGIMKTLGAGLLVLLLAVGGPFASPLSWRTSFLHHSGLVGFYKPFQPLPDEAVPGFYRRLRGETVVEHPWINRWDTNDSFHLYQGAHGGRVKVSSPQRILFRPPLALRNAVKPEPAALCRSGARYVIVHMNLAREENRIPGGRLSEFPELRRTLRQSALILAGRLRRQWGEPFHADRWIQVWDLQQTCSPGVPVK